MNWKKRAQSNNNDRDELKDVFEEISGGDDVDQKGSMLPIKGRRPSELFVPTSATEPEYIKTQEREKEVSLVEQRVSKYYSTYISEHIHHCVDSAIDSIIKLSKAFRMGSFAHEILNREERRDEIIITLHKILRAKIVCEFLEKMNYENKWSDMETEVISKVRAEELKKSYKQEEMQISKIMEDIFNSISFRSKKKNELLGILEIIKKELINSVIHKEFNYQNMEELLYGKRSFK